MPNAIENEVKIDCPDAYLYRDDASEDASERYLIMVPNYHGEGIEEVIGAGRKASEAWIDAARCISGGFRVVA